MFKLAKPSKIKWPVTVNVPQDGGKTKKYVFTVEFDVIDQDEFDAIYTNGGKDADLILKVVKGWGSDVCAESGDPLEFGAENLGKMIAIPYVRAGIVQAYIECSHGKAAEKN